MPLLNTRVAIVPDVGSITVCTATIGPFDGLRCRWQLTLGTAFAFISVTATRADMALIEWSFAVSRVWTRIVEIVGRLAAVIVVISPVLGHGLRIACCFDGDFGGFWAHKVLFSN